MKAILPDCDEEEYARFVFLSSVYFFIFDLVKFLLLYFIFYIYIVLNWKRYIYVCLHEVVFPPHLVNEN